MTLRSICIGYDAREQAAYAVAAQTCRMFGPRYIPIIPLVLDKLQARGLYTRPIDYLENGTMWDPISEAPMSTEFAISRFLTPIIAEAEIAKFAEQGRLGWVLFMDCDVMVRQSLTPLFTFVEKHPNKALFCVHHKHEPPVGKKMDAQEQVRYARKNWSSVMLFNCDHIANRKLTVELINSVPGRDLHRFCWLEDKDIGELDVKWNWLAGHSSKTVNPSIVHFTEGGPWFKQYRDVPYADEWLTRLLYS